MHPDFVARATCVLKTRAKVLFSGGQSKLETSRTRILYFSFLQIDATFLRKTKNHHWSWLHVHVCIQRTILEGEMRNLLLCCILDWKQEVQGLYKVCTRSVLSLHGNDESFRSAIFSSSVFCPSYLHSFTCSTFFTRSISLALSGSLWLDCVQVFRSKNVRFLLSRIGSRLDCYSSINRWLFTHKSSL